MIRPWKPGGQSAFMQQVLRNRPIPARNLFVKVNYLKWEEFSLKTEERHGGLRGVPIPPTLDLRPATLLEFPSYFKVTKTSIAGLAWVFR